MITLDDKIFRFIYIEAMRDATVQLSYRGDKKWLTEKDVMDSLKPKIEPLINKVLNDNYTSQQEYDKDFLGTTITICEYINKKANNNNFTFGNAQKLINMTLKYFYITTYKNDSSKNFFRFCHCPMDGQLLKNIWDKREELKLNSDIEHFLKSWGNENFETKDGKETYPKRYLLFQQAVRYFANKENINPLEYDYCVW